MKDKLLKFLQWLGLYKPIQAPVPLTPLQLLQAQLSSSVTATKSVLLEKAQMEGISVLATLCKRRDSATESGEQLLLEIIKQIELLEFVLRQKNKVVVGLQEYEALLGELVKSLVLIAESSGELVKDIDRYLRRMEDRILLDEADGRYRFHISENDKWVLLPLLSTLEKTPVRKNQAKRELVKLFINIPQLSLIDFKGRVPMRAVSFVEIVEMVKGKRIAAVQAGENGERYWYVF